RAGLVGATGGEDTGRGEGDGEDASGAHAGWTSRRSRLVPVDRRRRSAWRLRELEQVAVRIVHEGLHDVGVADRLGVADVDPPAAQMVDRGSDVVDLERHVLTVGS